MKLTIGKDAFNTILKQTSICNKKSNDPVRTTIHMTIKAESNGIATLKAVTVDGARLQRTLIPVKVEEMDTEVCKIRLCPDKLVKAGRQVTTVVLDDSPEGAVRVEYQDVLGEPNMVILAEKVGGDPIRDEPILNRGEEPVAEAVLNARLLADLCRLYDGHVTIRMYENWTIGVMLHHADSNMEQWSLLLPIRE